jgi:hypothetical protein
MLDFITPFPRSGSARAAFARPRNESGRHGEYTRLPAPLKSGFTSPR